MSKISLSELQEMAYAYCIRRKATSEQSDFIDKFIAFIELVQVAEETEIKEGNN